MEDFDVGDRQWDGIVSIRCYVPSQLRKRLHQRITAGLKEGGVSFLGSYTPEQIELGTGGPPDPDRLVTLDELWEEVASLEWEHSWTGRKMIQEGDYHNGVSAVVELAARKPASTWTITLIRPKASTTLKRTALTPDACRIESLQTAPRRCAGPPAGSAHRGQPDWRSPRRKRRTLRGP